MFIDKVRSIGNSVRAHSRKLGILGLTLTGTSVLHAEDVQGQHGGPEYIPGRYIVTFKEKGPKGRHSHEVEAFGKHRGVRMHHIYTDALNGFAADLSDEALNDLRNDPRVLDIEQDQIVRIDQRRGGGGGGSTSSQIKPWGITRIGLSTLVANGVDSDIAVVDTGIQPDHPDLNVVGGANFSSDIPLTAPAYRDTNGHGTHVAGTAAARNNTIGVVGVAPGARLWAVRVLGSNGSGTVSAVIAGVNWITANASTIDVANMSISTSNSSAMNTAVANSVAAGVTYVVSAGNGSVDARGTSPANNTNTGVITVSALSSTGVFASTSNRGLNYIDDSGAENGVDMIAPGVGVISTYIGSGYATMDGTSMASPHVAGAAALCKLKNPTYTPADVKQALMTSPPSGSWDIGPAGIFGLGTWRATSGDPDGFYEPLINAAPFVP